MIEFIQLRNFQRWKKLRLDLANRITTIIGQTEAGKSTILRALKWVGLNQFDGPANEQIHWDAKSSWVKLGFDGHVVKRLKSRTVNNLYELDGKEFRSFGSGKVPDPIAGLLSLTEANFQNQFDAHFWLSQSAGEISRQLNQIVNLTSIDSALSNITSRSRRAKTEVEVCERRLTQSIQERNELDWVPGVDEALINLERQEKRLDLIRPRISSLRSIVSECVKSRATIRIAGIREARGSAMLDIASRAQRIDKQTKRLSSLISEIESAEKIRNKTIGVLPDPKNIETMRKRRQKLQDLITRLEVAENSLAHWNTELQNDQKILIKKTKGMCPVCGRPLTTTKA